MDIEVENEINPQAVNDEDYQPRPERHDRTIKIIFKSPMNYDLSVKFGVKEEKSKEFSDFLTDYFNFVTANDGIISSDEILDAETYKITDLIVTIKGNIRLAFELKARIGKLNGIVEWIK